MELDTLLFFAALLACPIAMGGMMWMMSKNMSGQKDQSMAGDQIPANSAERLAALRQQRQALEAEIDEVTRLVELKAQREALLKEQTPVVDRADFGAEGSAAIRRAAQGGRGKDETYK